MHRVATLVLISVIAATEVAIPLYSCVSYAQSNPQSSQVRPIELLGLRVLEAKRTTVDSKQTIEITFDKQSAERLRRFTSKIVGREVVLLVHGKKLAKLLLREPITEGRAQLTGDIDDPALDSILSPASVIDLRLE